jgi:Arc/MetJ-type ribon-helix-helix transcriptional regulator
MVDADLAALYGVQTKALIQAVKRNRNRFPADFMFELTAEEDARLRSQTVTSKPGRGGRRTRPYAFTEQGVAMLSSVLRSERAVVVNVEIMRAFVRLRAMLAGHEDLARKLAALERKYDAQFKVVFDAIRDSVPSPSDWWKLRLPGASMSSPNLLESSRRAGWNASDVVLRWSCLLRLETSRGEWRTACPPRGGAVAAFVPYCTWNGEHPMAAKPLTPADLPEDLARLAQAQIEAGRCASVEEFLRAGAAALEVEQRRQEAKLAKLRAAIDEGDASGVFDGDPFASVRTELGLNQRG